MAATGEQGEQPSQFDVKNLLNNAWTRYIPMAGSVSTMIFSTNIMNPRCFRRVLSPYDNVVANCLWFNSHLGVGLYIYNRQHLQNAQKSHRVIYSVYGAVLFNFSIVLFWATCKTLLPRLPAVRGLFGIGSGLAFYAIGREYLNWVDKQAIELQSEE